MGNICRSPAAEGIAKKFLEKKGLNGTIEIDSAGTLDYHTGELPDSRMIKHASKRGYKLDSRARQFNPIMTLIILITSLQWTMIITVK